MSKYKHIVTEKEEGMTVNQILKANFSFSRRFITKMKFQELVDLNGVKTKGFIKPSPSDVISIRLPIEHNEFPAENIKLDIVYEDDDFLIINKQPGITVHPTKGHPNNTLANGIVYYINETNQNFKIRFCNRLDMDTSGIVIVAKNSNIQNEVSKQMSGDMVTKKYLAIVQGIIEEEFFTIDLPVGRPDPDSPKRSVLALEDGGKTALTDVKVLKRFKGNKISSFNCDATLVELSLHTGRTHQIRIHMSYMNHPIIGDTLYGGDNMGMISRQALHSHYVELIHPESKEKLRLFASIPEDFQSLITRLNVTS